LAITIAQQMFTFVLQVVSVRDWTVEHKRCVIGTAKNGWKGNTMKLAMKAMLIAAAALAFAQTANAGDAAKGEKVFKKCKACHKIGEGAKNSVGPMLNDVIGRPAAASEGYKYGKDLIAAGDAGLVWSEELIAQYVEDPKAFLRTFLDNSSAKSKMPLKLKKAAEREDVAAYVATFSTPAE